MKMKIKMKMKMKTNIIGVLNIQRCKTRIIHKIYKINNING
jgi:hypothetical protein